MFAEGCICGKRGWRLRERGCLNHTEVIGITTKHPIEQFGQKSHL